jgi:hypothetical protein
VSRRKTGPALLLACSLCAVAAAAAGTDLAGLLPSPGFVPGWRRSGPSVRFDGVDLYNHIDGAAEVFLELGFDRVLVQDYACGEDELTVELYAMTDEVAAAGVYLMKRGPGTPTPTLPGRHAFTPRQVISYRGNVLVIVTNDTGQGAVAAMVAAAAALLGALPEERPLPLGNSLPVAGRLEGTERIIRGPFTLQRVVTLGDGDVLELAGRTTAVAADYADGSGGSYTRIAVTYPDDAAAKAALAHLRGHLDPYLEVVRDGGDAFVFRDGAGHFGEVRDVASRVELWVHLARDPADVRRGE